MKFHTILILFLFSNFTSNCQITNVFCNEYKKNDGQSFGLVRCIQKDSFGFIWIGTENGIYKLNGNKSIEYLNSSTDSKNTICGNDVTDIIIPQGHKSIIAIQALAGISQINLATGVVESKNFLQTIKNRGIISVCHLNSFLYIITVDGTLIKYDYLRDKIETEIALSINNTKPIRKLFIVNNKLIIASENGELFILDASTLSLIQKITLPEKLLFHWKYNIHFENGICYFVTASGIFSLSISLNNTFDLNVIINYKKKYGALIDCIKINEEYLVVTEKGFFQIRNGKWKPFNLVSTNNDKWNEVVQFLKDGDNIWILTGKGLFFIKSLYPPIEPFNIKNNHGINTYKQLLKIDDSLLLASNQEIIEIINTTTRQSIKKFGINNDYIFYKALNNKIYGISELDKIIITKEPNNKFYKKNYANSNNELNLKQYSLILNDSLIISLNELLGTVEEKNLKTKKVKILFKIFDSGKSLNSSFFRTIKKASDSVFWCILSDQVLEYNIINKKIKTIDVKNPLSGKPYVIVMDIAKIKNYYYLVVNGIGLVRINLDNNKTEKYEKSNGFNSLGLINCFVLNDSSLLISSDNGLYLFNTNSKKVKYFNENDGILGGVGFLENATTVNSNKIFLGTTAGITVVNTANFATNIALPKMFFTTINIETQSRQIDTSNIFFKTITIPNDYIQVKIEFLNLNYSNQEKIKYWYRITELGNTWIDLKTQNYLTLIGLQHGTYTLQIKAANEDGLECAPKELKIKILPHWYQTILFKILTTLAILSLLYLLYNFRIRQLKRILTVRQKISANLHDDIGSTLSSINMYSQIAQLKPSDGQHIQTIQQNTQEALQKLDDIVWATNPKNDQIKNLVERINNFSKEILEAKNVNFNFDYDEVIINAKINEATRQNLFLICKEAVNNIAKYAQAKNCNISISIKNKNINCIIADDGIGFDTKLPTERNGLLNMQLRTQQLKGKFVIDSVPNKGTTINVQLPL